MKTKGILSRIKTDHRRDELYDALQKAFEADAAKAGYNENRRDGLAHSFGGAKYFLALFLAGGEDAKYARRRLAQMIDNPLSQ